MRERLRARRRSQKLEKPAAGKSMMRRELTRIVTPGMAVDDELLSPEQSRRVAAVGKAEGGLAVAFLDLSTGQLKAASVQDERQLLEELWRLHAERSWCLPDGLPLPALAMLELSRGRRGPPAGDGPLAEASSRAPDLRRRPAIAAACHLVLAYARGDAAA